MRKHGPQISNDQMIIDQTKPSWDMDQYAEGFGRLKTIDGRFIIGS